MRYFVKMISRTATKLDSKEAIEIGVLVTKLYMYHGVVAREGVQIIKQLGVVNNSILKWSQAQLHLHATEEREEEEDPVAIE